LQIEVSHHTMDPPWQSMKSCGLVIRFATTLSTSWPYHVFCD